MMEYNGHILERNFKDPINLYKCKKCLSLLVGEAFSDKYWLLDDDFSTMSDLTCDEMIIKKILE